MVDNVNVLVHKLKQLLYVASNNYQIDLPVHNFGKKLEQMKNGTWGYLTDLQSVVTIEPPKEKSNNPLDWKIHVKKEFVQQETEKVDKQLANSVHILIPIEVNGTIQWGFQHGTTFSEMISVEDTKYEGKCVMVQREIPPGTAIPFLGRLPVTNDTERMIKKYDNEDYDMTASVRIPVGDMAELKMDHIEWTQPLKGNNSALNAHIYCSPESEEKWALPNSFIGARCNEPSADPFTIITHILEQLPVDEKIHSTPLFNENKSENPFDKPRCQQSLQFHVQWLNTMEEYHYRRLLKDKLSGWLKILPFLFRSTMETTDDTGTYKPVGLSRRSFLIAMFVGRERQHRVLYVLNLLLLAYKEITIDEIVDENTLISWQSHSLQHLLAKNRQKGLYCQIIKYVKMGVVFDSQALLPERDHVPRVTPKGPSYSGWPKWDGAHLKEDKDLRRSVQLQNDRYPADILRTFNWRSQEPTGVPQNKWVVLEQVSSDGYYKIGYLSAWVVSFKTSPSNTVETHSIRDKLRKVISGESRLSWNECRKLKLNYPKRPPQHLYCTDVFIRELGSVRVPADQTKLLVGKYLLATKVETRKIGIVHFVPKEGSASSSHGGKKRKRVSPTMYKKTVSVVKNLESNLPPYGENELDGSLLDGVNTRMTTSTSPVTPYYILYGNGKAFSESYVPNASVVSTTKWLRERDIRTGTTDYSHCFKDSKNKDSKNMLPLVYVITLKRLYPGDTVTFCYNHGGAHHRKMHNLKMKMKNSSIIPESEREAFYTTITDSLHRKKILEFRRESHLDAFNAHYRPTYIPSTVCLLGSENLCETSEELYDRMWK